MRREVTVGLVDLKILVGMCMDQQVDARAQVMVLTEPGRSDPTAAFEFAGLVEEAKPEATKRVRSHFHRLLEALENGNDCQRISGGFCERRKSCVTEAARLRIRGQNRQVPRGVNRGTKAFVLQASLSTSRWRNRTPRYSPWSMKGKSHKKVGDRSMNLTGYIDESINKDRHLFTMSAIISERMDWIRFEADWENCIEGINRQLKKDGRTPISRYHASDFSNGKGEFTGWTKEELIDLAKQLLNILKVHNTKTISYTIDLVALAEAFPQWKSDHLRGGYDFLTAFLVREIGEWLGKRNNPDARAKLIHDRCQHHQIIQESFQELMSHPKFTHRLYFETIEPSSWQECKLLQAADLVAYESMKDAERMITQRNRRLSLKLLLDMESFGMTAKYIGSDDVSGIAKAWEAHVESLSS